MIRTKEDLKYYIESDRIANSFSHESFPKRMLRILFPNLVKEFLISLRKTEYYHNCSKFNVLGLLLRGYYSIKLRHLSFKLGFSIPINVFGPGLSLPHNGTIVVNQNARVGKNCRLHVCTNIGASGGSPEAPQIGDNVYIGPGAIIYGNIIIANNVTIGANATVNRSFQKENVVIAGTPAVIVKENVTNWITFNKVKLQK